MSDEAQQEINKYILCVYVIMLTQFNLQILLQVVIFIQLVIKKLGKPDKVLLDKIKMWFII